MLTDEHLVLERANDIGGVQRVYRFSNGYGLSLINLPMAHAYPFAWEAAVLKDVPEDGHGGEIDYTTPLTEDVEVFATDAEANEFIKRAAVELTQKE